MTFEERPETPRIPAHIAIIMDGNGRWARQRGLHRALGHKQGVETVRKITEEAVRMGVKYLTLYTFSTENWNRPPEEVAALMNLVLDSLEEEIFIKNNVRFVCIGDRSRLPHEVAARLAHTEQTTAKFDCMTLVIALSYSSKWELTEAVKAIATQCTEGTLSPADITEDTVAAHLQTAAMPDPDLLIRTGGEKRISNYLLWQCAYTEFYFCDTFWPDFDAEHLHEAVSDYATRQRRYGKTGQQIEENTTIHE